MFGFPCTIRERYTLHTNRKVHTRKGIDMELDFNKTTTGAYVANGDAGKYTLTLANGQWTGKVGKDVIFKGVKGFTNAKTAAQDYENENEPEPVKPARTAAKSTGTASKPAVKATASKPEPAKSATATRKPAKVADFMEYDEWRAEQPKKARNETPEQFANRTNKLAYGRAKSKYNRD